MSADLELTPRSVFSISKDQRAVRTIALANILGSNTVASHAMAIYNSVGTAVTSNFSEGSSVSSTTLTFGVKGYAEGTYTIIFSITCTETTPNGNAITFPVEVVLEVVDTATSATATTAETLESYALVTLDDVKAVLNIPFATATYDNVLILLINDATAWIEKYCTRRFKQTIYTNETHSGSGEKGLWILNPPIISVSAVSIDDEAQAESTGYTDTDGYVIEPILQGCKTLGMLYRQDSWDKGEQNIKVTYTGGYATIPYDVRRAAALTIKEWYDIYKNKEGYNPGKYQYRDDFLSDKIMRHIDILLAPYMRMSYL
jgi:hypothetical protein